MPRMNYCKKCKTEVPAGEYCPHCSGKLTKTGERISYGMIRTPVNDWFSWNQALRIALPTLLLVAAATLFIEGSLSGETGIQALFLEGFFWTLMGVLGFMLLAMLVLLLLQGRENLHVVMDREGVHIYTYLDHPTTLRLYARFLTWASVETMQDEQSAASGFLLIKKAELLWTDVKRVRCWQEGKRILLFRPTWWQALVLPCLAHEYAEAEEFVRKKLGRNKKVKILPKKETNVTRV